MQTRSTTVLMTLALFGTTLGCTASTGNVADAPLQGAGVALAPEAAKIPPGSSIAFTVSVSGLSSTDVAWSVEEGSAGGTVSSTGLYTAPQVAGTYHVVATSVADPSQSGRSTLTVDPIAPPYTPPVTGPQFYVAANGSDSNPGSLAQPWRTIQKAMNSATPGSTVNIRAGTYPERLNVNVSGAAGNFITFQPYGFSGAPGCGGHTSVACGGEQVVLDYSGLGTVSDGVPYLKMNGVSYVRIQGLTFQNYQWIGAMQRGGWITGGSHDIEFKFNRILDVHTTAPLDRQNALLGFWIDAGSHNVWFYGNELGRIDTSDGEVLTPANCDRVTIENNWIHDTDQIAIAIGQGATNTAVRGNYLEYCSMARDGSARYGIFSGAIYNNGGSYTTIEGNTVTHSGFAIEVSCEPSYPVSHDIVIRNNVCANSSRGIMVGNWYSSDTSRVTNVSVLNNTIYGCQAGFEMQPFSNARFEDNIVASCSTSIVNSAGMSPAMDYNLYFGSSVGPDAHPVTANPQFVNAAGDDFRLASTSPAIDVGDPGLTTANLGAIDFAGNLRIVNRIDIGAYEAQ